MSAGAPVPREPPSIAHRRGYDGEVRRRNLAFLLLGGLGIAVAIWVAGLLQGSEARSTLDRFLAAWEEEEYAVAAGLTDANERTVESALQANRDGLDGAALETEIEEFSEGADSASARIAMRWRIPVFGRFDYSTNVELRSTDGGEWEVRWGPTVVHPELAGDERLGTVRELPPRAPILDRDGAEIVKPRPVVDVGLVPNRLEDRGEAIAAVAETTGAQARQLRRSIRAAGPEQFVTAITLRRGEVPEVRRELERIAGVQFSERTQPLAPTREFARTLLGTVAPITEEQLEELGEPYGVGDEVGQWGLQAAFERRLAGTPGFRIVVRNAAGVPVETLRETDGEAGEPLRTTLDARVQSAAEEALGDRDRKAALVAIEPSSGDLLAVANRPVEETFNRALEGRYPPGSTFKVITTAALLRGGLDPDETVECPPSITIEGREFVNFEGGAAGAVPFSEDFAESCNTAFVSLADRLEPSAFSETAHDFGLGRKYELPLAAFSGEVPEPKYAVEQAAQMIGQGRVLVSPLTLAGVAATVADGRWRGPRLIDSDPPVEGPRVEAEVLGELQSLMRAVVSSGTGTALADVPGQVRGKSGTAEYGSGNPPPTHAWFMAIRDNVALAVLVEDARSGGEVAAPIAAEALNAIAP
jgi:cell division protein FtsI/penicillin-binding protein 2